MKFVNLNSRLDRTDRNSKYKKKRSLKKLFIRVVVVLAILFLVLYLPLRGVYASAKNLSLAGKAFAFAAQNQNFDEMKTQTTNLKNAASSLEASLNFLFWARFVPFFGGYYADSKHFASALNYEMQAAEELMNYLEQYKSELGFNNQPIPSQDRVAQVVKILDKANPKLPELEPFLKKAADEVKSIDVNIYPENLGKYGVRSIVDTAKNFIIGADYAVTKGKGALFLLPDALGNNSPKNYLIIFQNDKEIRGTGGFMTAYAFMRFDKGHISTTQSDDIYRLDERLLATCESKICPLTPPEPIVKYLPEVTGKARSAWSMRDSNLSPDVPTSMKDFERMYSLLGQGLPFDGIILIDSHVVEELIKITGPVEVFGVKYSADADPRCNCPNVIYELENYAQIVQKGEQDRKAILGTLMQQILAKALSSSTEKLPELVNAGVKLANAKDVLFYMHDSKLQKALAQLNWTGKVKDYKGDFLMVNDSNFAGGKSNLYVTQDVTLDIDINRNGKVKNKLTLKYSNPQKYDSWLNSINRDYVRIYVPKGAKLISSKGSEVEVTTISNELGKTVFEAFIQVRPQNSTTLSFEYELPGEFQGKEYPILIQKQPGSKHFPYTIKVNGRTKEQFELSADKELAISL